MVERRDTGVHRVQSPRRAGCWEPSGDLELAESPFLLSPPPLLPEPLTFSLLFWPLGGCLSCSLWVPFLSVLTLTMVGSFLIPRSLCCPPEGWMVALHSNKHKEVKRSQRSRSFLCVGGGPRLLSLLQPAPCPLRDARCAEMIRPFQGSPTYEGPLYLRGLPVGVSTLSIPSCFTRKDPVKFFSDGDTSYVGRDSMQTVPTIQVL